MNLAGETIDEYKKKDKEEQVQYRLPFGGGSGAGVSINPVAFLVVCKDSIKLMPISHSSTVDKLMDYVPDVIEKAHQILDKKMESKEETETDVDKPKKNVTVKTTEKKIAPNKKEKTVKVDYEVDNPTEYLEDE